MLAQNFKSAADLDISEEQKDALIKTLVLLETGKMHHTPIDHLNFDLGHNEFSGHFNMHTWGRLNGCGTIACIGGTAELLGAKGLALRSCNNMALSDLFEPKTIPIGGWERITCEQAATALRSYLTTGEARWDLAVA